MTFYFRTVVAVGATAAALLSGATTTQAQPPPAPNCTAADLSSVSAGVQAATSQYLFARPDVNGFFTSLKGLPKEEVQTRVADYAAANPQVKADLQGIRQPMVDFRNRCDAPAPQ
ncbi:heme-binding protein [Mycolicibacterium baixiangningiae]|uniref:heme-binding protein n=1 Tax=Mycolicibacterium baixiangningiae TaxID=2761578 RepID=UPI0018685C39|nr:heme-binding protein [Mycolicibacterium baixiangningiae]